MKFGGEEVWLEIGDRNQFREFCTVHRGTAKGGGITRIGSDSLFMAYTHVAHDCQVGNRIVFANNATLAGHVEVHDDATISALLRAPVLPGRAPRLRRAAIPWWPWTPCRSSRRSGRRPACYGLNTIGLKRKGIGAGDHPAGSTAAYRLLVRSRLLDASRPWSRIRAELGGAPAPTLSRLPARLRRELPAGAPQVAAGARRRPRRRAGTASATEWR